MEGRKLNGSIMKDDMGTSQGSPSEGSTVWAENSPPSSWPYTLKRSNIFPNGEKLVQGEGGNGGGVYSLLQWFVTCQSLTLLNTILLLIISLIMEKLNFSPLGGNNEIKVEKDPCGITATSLFQNEIQPPPFTHVLPSLCHPRLLHLFIPKSFFAGSSIILKSVLVSPFLTSLSYLFFHSFNQRASLVSQTVKNLPAMQETWIRSLGWEDTLEKGMATHSSILAWIIPWTEEPGRQQFMASQRVRHDCVTNTFTFTLYFHSFSKYIKSICSMPGLPRWH